MAAYEAAHRPQPAAVIARAVERREARMIEKRREKRKEKRSP
jgi:hypothetical protein